MNFFIRNFIGSKKMKLYCYLLFIISTVLGGCTPDYQVQDHSEVRVVVDYYVQPDKLEKLDVLVALDTSGSMRDKEIIKFANQTNTILAFSNTRHFKH